MSTFCHSVWVSFLRLSRFLWRLTNDRVNFCFWVGFCDVSQHKALPVQPSLQEYNRTYLFVEDLPSRIWHRITTNDSHKETWHPKPTPRQGAGQMYEDIARSSKHWNKKKSQRKGKIALFGRYKNRNDHSRITQCAKCVNWLCGQNSAQSECEVTVRTVSTNCVNRTLHTVSAWSLCKAMNHLRKTRRTLKSAAPPFNPAAIITNVM